jgi:hypothetical protein
MTTARIDLTRRQFLQGTAAAAVAAPLIVPSSALGDEKKKPASERLTLGFIGMGTQNGYHLGWFLDQKDCQVVAVCDVDTTRREHAKKRVEARYGKERKGSYKGCAAYNDLRELIDRKDIDGVVIATPDHWHAIPVLLACRAKKDIYCEKPLTLTIHEAKALIDAVRKYNVVFQTGSQQRSSAEFRLVCELVRSGRIGKVKEVYVNVGGPSKWCDLPGEKMEPGLDWDRWLGPAPKRPYNHILSPRGVHKHFPATRRARSSTESPSSAAAASSSWTAGTRRASRRTSSRSRSAPRTSTCTSRRATSATGSSACGRASGRSATWRSGPAR